MSIASMRKTYEVWENTKVEDDYGNYKDEEVQVGTAEVTINHSNATNLANDVRYSKVTHFGLTLNKELKKGQVLVLDGKRYVIELPPNNVARYTQLYLREVVIDG